MKRLLIGQALLALILPVSAHAANLAVTGGTNGASCNSGGYFTPSSINATAGDTITFSVPSNDPYVGGLQVNSLPQGSLMVARGGSQTTSALPAGTYHIYGTWPNEPQCMKGSATITVAAAPAPAPAPTPKPTPAPTQTTTPKTTATAPTTSTPAPATTTPAAQPSTDDTATPDTSADSSQDTSPAPATPKAADTSGSNMQLVYALAAGGGLLVLAALFAIYWFVIRRLLQG